MYAQLVTPEMLVNFNHDVLRDAFETAGLRTEIDPQGDLLVEHEEVKCVVLPTESGNRIQLVAFFGSKPGRPRSSQLEFCNRVNEDFTVVRACISENDEGLIFDYFIPVAGGVTTDCIVLAAKFFLSATYAAIEQHDTEDVVL
ncbi:MAG: YbjN domain-containing protein [bacterium]|nr:YbjN domain-containing protein [bacterium]